MTIRLGLFAALAFGFLIAGTGCANSKEAAERDSLLTQNKDLQAQLDAANAAHQADQTKINAMSSQLAAAPPTASEGPSTPGMGPTDLSAGGGRISSRGGSAGGVTVHTTSNTGGKGALAHSKVTIPGEVLFDSGKTTLTATATKTLDTIAATLKKQYTGSQIVIEGYTDATPVKSTSPLKSNEALATARANAVKSYLVKKGIPTSEMSVKAFASSDPASTKNPALNRRVEVAVMVEK